MSEEAVQISATEVSSDAATRPDNLPEKFWNPDSGSVGVDALVASYRALEQKMSSGDGAGTRLAESRDRAVAAPNHPPVAESSDPPVAVSDPPVAESDPADPAPGYEIATGHGLFESHDGVNEVLRDAGFTQDQAQVVYDLASQVLQPIIDDYGAERNAMADEARLEQQFGGTQKWAETQRQLRVWGQRHLPTDAYASLSTSYDGVLALHRLMQNEEPSVLRGGAVGEAADEGTLRAMIRDPRYWRDRNPALLRKVSDGFKRLYPDE
jgi:hypothetical protein